MQTVADFIFLHSKTTVDGDCNHEIKRCLLFGRKAMTNLDGTLEGRDTIWHVRPSGLGIKPMSAALEGGFFTHELPGKPGTAHILTGVLR